MKWKPIKTAPRDGTKVLVIAFDQGKFYEPVIVSWCDECERFEDDGCEDEYGAWNLTNWMPLPQPPETQCQASPK